MSQVIKYVCRVGDLNSADFNFRSVTKLAIQIPDFLKKSGIFYLIMVNKFGFTNLY
jgi:hypothetical protein